MDADFDRAASKHRLSQRHGAIRAKQRQRPSAEAAAPNNAPTAVRAPRPEFTDSAAKTKALVELEPERMDVEIICPNEPFQCFICTEDKSGTDRIIPHRCSAEPQQRCCSSCYVSWIESQIDSEAPQIRCCYCNEELGQCEIGRLVDAEHLEKWATISLQRSLKQSATFVCCPKCPSGGWINSSAPASACGWRCPECNHSFHFCPLCRRDHGSISCKRYQQLRKEIMDQAAGTKDNEVESASTVQRSSKNCPSCQMPIQKAGGCKFMNCPNCYRHFCWRCGKVFKGSHQSHDCDAGFETSEIATRTPTGRPCLELTKIFVNVLDLDHVEVLNAPTEDAGSFKQMLVPGISQDHNKQVRFVGPSECDGEMILKVPFSFPKALSWEITHVIFGANHPPAPGARPPVRVQVLANRPDASFDDFDDGNAANVELVKDEIAETLTASLESFRSKGTFRRVTYLTLRISVSEAEDGEVFFNRLCIFGLPSDAESMPTHRNRGSEDDLIVNPMLKAANWGKEEPAKVAA